MPEDVPMLDLWHIRHQRSAEWSPLDHIDKYLNYWLRRRLNKEVRNRLRAECPRPTMSHKVTNTHDFDTYMSNYMTTQGVYPRKGIKKGLKSDQDKLLDIVGPLTQALVLTDKAICQGCPLDPLIMWNWLQHCIYLLGIENPSLSSEHRRAVLLRIDPQLN